MVTAFTGPCPSLAISVAISVRTARVTVLLKACPGASQPVSRKVSPKALALSFSLSGDSKDCRVVGWYELVLAPWKLGVDSFRGITRCSVRLLVGFLDVFRARDYVGVVLL